MVCAALGSGACPLLPREGQRELGHHRGLLTSPASSSPGVEVSRGEQPGWGGLGGPRGTEWLWEGPREDSGQSRGAQCVWGKAPGQGRNLGRDPDDKDPGAPPAPPEDRQPLPHRTECLSGCSWGRGSPLPGASIPTEQEGWPCPPERGTQNFLTAPMKTCRARRAAPLRSLPAAPREGPPSMICSDSADTWGFLGRVTGPAFHRGCGHGQKRPPWAA